MTDRKLRIQLRINKIIFFFFSIDATGTEGHMCQYVNDGTINSSMTLRKFKNLNKPRLCFYAIKYIKEGEEMLYDYGDEKNNLWCRKEVRIFHEHINQSSVVVLFNQFFIITNYLNCLYSF